MLLIFSQSVSAFAEPEVSLFYPQGTSSYPSTASFHIVIPYAVFKFLSMGVLQVDDESRIF